MKVKLSILLLMILLSFQYNSIAQPYGTPPFQHCYVHTWYDYNTCEQYILTQLDEKKSTESYDDFESMAGKIIVNKNNRFGILNCDLSTFIPCEFDSVFSLYSVNDFFWSIQQNDSTYLLNYDGDTILSTNFDAIDLNLGHNINLLNNVRHEEYFQPLSPSIFGISKNDKRGIIQKDGRILFPPIYDKIEIFVLNTDMDKPNKTYFDHTPFLFWELHSNGKRIITSFDGQTIYSDSSNSTFTDIILLEHLKEPIIAVKGAGNDYYRLLNVHSGKMSDASYHDVFKNSHTSYFLAKQFKNSRENLFLNHEMKVIYKTEQHEQNSFYLVYSDLYMFRSTDTIGNVGLINLDGEEIIPPNYRIIQSKISDLGIYFWATPITTADLNKYNATKQFHVFDSNGNLVNKVEFYEPHYNDKLNATAAAFFKNQHRDQYVLHSENNPVTIDLYWVTNKGKWGAFNAKGEQVIPYGYDVYRETVNIGIEGQEQHGHIVQKGKRIGVVNSKGKIIHPFEYTTYEVNWQGTSLNYYTKNGTSSLTTSTGENIDKNIDTALVKNIYLSREGIKRLNSESKSYYSVQQNEVFIVKNDSLYHIVDKELISCDSNYLAFDNQLEPFAHFLLNKSGQLITFPKATESFHNPNFLVAAHDSTAEILSLSGKKIGIIEHFEIARNYGDHLLVKLTNQKIGLRTLNGKDWLVSPHYYDFIKSPNPTQFWANTKKESYRSGYNTDDMKGDWLLIDDLDSVLLDSTVFNYPPIIQPKSANTAIFSTQNKYGIIDESNTIILEPLYDFITPSDLVCTYYINQKNKWALFHYSGAKSAYYDEIFGSESLTFFKAETFTETDTLISILNFDIHLGFVELNAPQNYSALISEINLVTLIDSLVVPTRVKNRSELAKLWDQINPSDKYEKPLKPFNNIILLQAFNKPVSKINATYLSYNYPNFRLDYKYRNSKFVNSLVNSDNEGWHFNNSQYIQQYYQPLEKHYFLYSKSSVYSKVVIQKSSANISPLILNYWLTADKAIPLKFNDLFKNPKKAHKFFYKFIEEYATEHQLFGASCPNFSMIFERYIQNFYFSKRGLSFSQYIYETAPKNEVFVPYEAFSKYLKKIYQLEDGW